MQLTARGDELIDGCGELLEARFEAFVQLCGVDYGTYQDQTRRLLDKLKAAQTGNLPRLEME